LNFNLAQNFSTYDSQMSPQPWYNPSPWNNPNPWKYHGPPIPPPYQYFSSMPQHQWSQPSQGWRPQNFQQPTLISLPPQNNALPKKPQLPSQPAPNPNNKQFQLVYNNNTTYQTYSSQLQEINIRSRNFLQQQPKLIENEEYERRYYLTSTTNTSLPGEITRKENSYI